MLYNSLKIKNIQNALKKTLCVLRSVKYTPKRIFNIFELLCIVTEENL